MGKGVKKYSKLMAICVAIVTLLSSLGITVYAWMISKKDVGMSFTAGSGADILLYYATYDKVSQSYNWLGGNSLSSDKTFGDEFSGVDSPLHLGQIENLLYREKENVSWFALKVKTNGNRHFKGLRLSFDSAKPATLYKDVETLPTEITDPPALEGMKKHIENLVIVDNLVVSDTPIENFFALPEINGLELNRDYPDFKRVACLTPYDSSIVVDDLVFSGEYKGNEEFYYIYFRVLPELDNYGSFTRYIAKYLPCVVTFNLGLNITTDSLAVDAKL